MKVDRYITGFFLLCFSVFLGHNLVPHYHISDIVGNPLASDCSSEHGDQEKHHNLNDTSTSKHPSHCHAFNDVIFEKFTPLKYNPNPGLWQDMAMSGLQTNDEVSWLLPSYPFVYLKQSCLSHSDWGTRSLRAPPVSV